MKYYTDVYETYKDGLLTSRAEGMGFEAKNNAHAWKMVCENERDVLEQDGIKIEEEQRLTWLVRFEWHDDEGVPCEEIITLYIKTKDGYWEPIKG